MKLLVALSLLAIMFAGCTKDNGFTTPPTDDEGRYVIEMTNALQFKPARAEVPVGATVVFTVTGSVPHDTQGPTWKSPVLSQGEEYEVTLESAGDIAYWCNLHPEMKGVLRVV